MSTPGTAGALGPSGQSGWRAAALPSLALLGAVLPLTFLPQAEDFLYYLRPPELLPAYGTAWLLLAALAVPLWLFALLLQAGLGLSPLLRRLRGTLSVVLAALAAALTLEALIFCLLVWVQTFGWLRGVSLHGALFWLILILGGIGGCTVRARSALQRLRPLLHVCAIAGALCALTIPFFGWNGAASAHAPAAATAADAPGARRPNIVLLTIDALSAEHMSLYGASRLTSPQLDAFARGATTFEHAYSDGNYTTPGIASILTGTRPWTHRALQLQSWPDERTRAASLPALLHAAGYRTGYVSTNSAAGAAKNGFGSDFDFAARDRIKDPDLCRDALSARLKYACAIAAMPLFTELAAVFLPRPVRDNSHYDPRLATAPALQWLRQVDRSRPIFLWVHLFPPHAPYAAPAPWIGYFDPSGQARSIATTEPHWVYTMRSAPPELTHTLEARYDESIRYVDHYAGEFLEQSLQLLGPDTVVVVTADHGESFRHGYGAHTGPGLFDEIIHVPLIIKLPGQTQAIRSPTVVEQVDIAPTLAQLAGISAAPSLWEGRSLLAAWGYRGTGGADLLPTKPAFSMNFEQNRRHGRLTTGSVAVIDGHWKLVHYLGHPHYPQMPPLHDALYDLAADPKETHNLAAAQPAEVAQLRALIAGELARHGGAE
jgi:arylsulfatase A-like enzyme